MILMGKLKEEPLVRSRRRWEGNVEMEGKGRQGLDSSSG
jgi:hypothetical protein